MKTTNLLILLVVLIVLLVVVLSVARPVQAPTQPVQQTQQQAQQQTAGNMTTTPNGLSFTVQQPFALAVTQDQVLAKAVIPPCDPGFDYCIYYNGTQYQNTNFESAGIAIKERKDLPSQQSCISTQPEGYNGLKPKTKTYNGYVVGSYTVSGAAAGSSETGTEYRVWDGSNCFALRTRVAQAQFENYPANSIKEFTAADRTAFFGQLQAILNSMTVRGGQLTFPAS